MAVATYEVTFSGARRWCTGHRHTGVLEVTLPQLLFSAAAHAKSMVTSLSVSKRFVVLSALPCAASAALGQECVAKVPRLIRVDTHGYKFSKHAEGANRLRLIG